MKNVEGNAGGYFDPTKSRKFEPEKEREMVDTVDFEEIKDAVAKAMSDISNHMHNTPNKHLADAIVDLQSAISAMRRASTHMVEVQR